MGEKNEHNLKITFGLSIIPEEVLVYLDDCGSYKTAPQCARFPRYANYSLLRLLFIFSKIFFIVFISLVVQLFSAN